ncbi:MAG: hypothetical protein HY735_18920, partial [Verrucomicrobia bacterium]|nr:hypothetical protein [Verrucomicrobiota bacterium]
MASKFRLCRSRLSKTVGRTAPAPVSLAAILCWLPLAAQAQVLIFQETFETEGEGTRYVSEGSDAYEPARLARELNRFDQGGPVYWARKSKVSLVGVPEQTPARRALMCWHHSIDASLVTQEFLSLFDSVVKWLVKDKANATVLFSPPPGGSGDTVLVERLASNGYKIVEDDGSALSSRPAVDLVIASSNGTAGAGPSRFALYPVPLLTYNTANHDDELLSTAGQPGQTLAIGDITIEAANHPAAGGKTGAFKVVAGQAQFDTISRLLPESAIILATFQQPKAADPAVTEKAPFIVLLEEGSSGGKFYSGGPFIG